MGTSCAWRPWQTRQPSLRLLLRQRLLPSLPPVAALALPLLLLVLCIACPTTVRSDVVAAGAVLPAAEAATMARVDAGARGEAATTRALAAASSVTSAAAESAAADIKSTRPGDAASMRMSSTSTAFVDVDGSWPRTASAGFSTADVWGPSTKPPVTENGGPASFYKSGWDQNAPINASDASNTDGDSDGAFSPDTIAPKGEELPPRNPARKLLLVVELCRHGDRTPLSEYPNDVLPASKWPEGIGELTAIGERDHFELGRRLRTRYVDTGFLNPEFNIRDVYIRSTTIDRTLMSAYSQMAGMFPAGSARIHDVGSKFGLNDFSNHPRGLPHRWQPVPIHSEAITTDGLLLPGNNCPRFAQLRTKLRKAPAFVERSEAEQDLLANVAKISGLEKASLLDVWAINDVWVCNEAHGVPLSPGVTPEIRKRVRDISNWLLLYGNHGLEIQRLTAGLLLNEIKIRMEIAMQNVQANSNPKQPRLPSKKFVLYSAHDSTVAAALSALNIDYDTNPPYTSTLIWELSQETGSGEFYVKVEYNGKSVRVRDCGLPVAGDDACTLKDYIHATRAVTMKSSKARETECLVGIQRKLVVFTGWFSKSPNDILDGGTQQPPEKPVARSSSSLFYIFVLLLGCIVGGLSMRAKSSFDGYFLTRDHDSESEPTTPIRRLLKRSDRGILL
jgi:Histidine phosphatase superfamily (branch 2)